MLNFVCYLIQALNYIALEFCSGAEKLEFMKENLKVMIQDFDTD